MSGKLPRILQEPLKHEARSMANWVRWAEETGQLDFMHDWQVELDAFHNACCEAGVVFDYPEREEVG